MVYRVVPIVTGEMYHVFNRGVEKRDIFLGDKDYRRFIDTLVYYQNSKASPRFSLRLNKLIHNSNDPEQIKLVDIICFCLMPNHFHLLLKQRVDEGVANFIGRVANSYTRYFNTKYRRTGHLFQGPYKVVRIESDEQLLHVSRYIHLNPLVTNLVKELNMYEWSSYQEYIGVRPRLICNTKYVLGYFPNSDKGGYQKFVLDQSDYARSLELIKHLLIVVD